MRTCAGSARTLRFVLRCSLVRIGSEPPRISKVIPTNIPKDAVVAAESDHRRIDASAEDQRLRDAVEYACDFTPLSRRPRLRRVVRTSRSASKSCEPRRHRPQSQMRSLAIVAAAPLLVASRAHMIYRSDEAKGKPADSPEHVPPRKLEMSPPAPLAFHALECIGVPESECRQRQRALCTRASVPGVRGRLIGLSHERAAGEIERRSSLAPMLLRPQDLSKSYGHLINSLLRCCEGGRTICPR